jgi:nicotinate-nucleotide--dimethylbenzimidazole phosphoribosyltransferase
MNGNTPRRNLRDKTHQQHQCTIGAEPAVAHDLKLRRHVAAAAKPVGDIGEAVLVQRSGQERASAERQRRRGEIGQADSAQAETEKAHRAAEGRPYHRKQAVRADEILRHRSRRMRHRQAREKRNRGSEIVEPVIHDRESEENQWARHALEGNRMQFDSLDDIRSFCRDLPEGDAGAAEAAAQRQQVLTKPSGSLGRLEELAIWLARWRRRDIPRLDRVTIAVFAGNHGVAARGVSAYPQAVTEQMVANFAGGGAAINQIAKLAGASLKVVPIELNRPTRDFTVAPAMDADEFLNAVDVGYRAVPADSDLLAVGEMGIANTTTAAMLCTALLGGGAARWAGRGTGVDDAGLARKRAAIETALDFHRAISGDPLAVAAALGGRELAAIAGAILAARHYRVPVLLDGFVATAAIVPLARLNAGILDHCRAGHVSAESGHRALLAELGLDPLLDLNMRLGEASGAGVAILLLRAALACHAGMATFAEAGVSGAG